MGCNNSARLSVELQAAKQETEELRASLKLTNDMKDAFQQEIAKAKLAVMSLTADNEKMSYELHVSKNSDYQNNSGIFESTKEEFLKMKQWTEMEIRKANEILSTLLTTSMLPKEDERHQHIIQIIDEMHDNEYDPVKLLELGRLRFRYIDELLSEMVDFKNKMMIQLKAMEVTVTSALAKSPSLNSKEITGPIIQASIVTKLILIRDLIKRVGFPDSECQGLTDTEQRELETKVEELTAQVQLQQDTIDMLKLARAGQPPNSQQAKVTELEGNLAAANGQLAQKNGELTATKARVTELQDEIRMLQSKLKVLQDTSAAGSDVEALRETVAGLSATGEKLVQEAEAVKEKLVQHKQKSTEVLTCARKVKASTETLDTLLQAVEDLDSLLGTAVA